MPNVRPDHRVAHVPDWPRANACCGYVLGAEVAEVDGWAYRFGEQQLNPHGRLVGN